MKEEKRRIGPKATPTLITGSLQLTWLMLNLVLSEEAVIT